MYDSKKLTKVYNKIMLLILKVPSFFNKSF